MRKPEKEKKKNLFQNSIPTRPLLENSQKNGRNFKKIKKCHSSIISIQTREREKKILVPNSIPTRPGQENSKKKKKLKNSKN